MLAGRPPKPLLTISTREGGRCREAEKELTGRGDGGKGNDRTTEKQGGDTWRQSCKGADEQTGETKAKEVGEWCQNRKMEDLRGWPPSLLPPPLTPAKRKKAAGQEEGPERQGTCRRAWT